MSQKPKKLSKEQQEIVKQKLTPIYRKIGFLTFVIGLAAIVIGLLIDRNYDTTPIFTLVALVITTPVVYLMNTRMLRKEVARIVAESKGKTKKAS